MTARLQQHPANNRGSVRKNLADPRFFCSCDFIRNVEPQLNSRLAELALQVFARCTLPNRLRMILNARRPERRSRPTQPGWSQACLRKRASKPTEASGRRAAATVKSSRYDSCTRSRAIGRSNRDRVFRCRRDKGRSSRFSASSHRGRKIFCAL